MSQLFYSQKLENGFAYLDEEESRHLITVLRKKVGDKLIFTDGKGFFYEGELAATGKKESVIRILSQNRPPADARSARLHLAIAPTKQIERFEWFLEKAVEMGVDEITPLLCKRSERNQIRRDRLEKIMVSAMKQSLHATLPVLNDLTPFSKWAATVSGAEKFIAWCAEYPLPHLKDVLADAQPDLVIAIGPEGDFSPEEQQNALSNGFRGISLGHARLRTETAGILAVAAANLRFSEV